MAVFSEEKYRMSMSLNEVEAIDSSDRSLTVSDFRKEETE